MRGVELLPIEQDAWRGTIYVDLRIGHVVDLPNFTVYAMLPLDVFTSPSGSVER